MLAIAIVVPGASSIETQIISGLMNTHYVALCALHKIGRDADPVAIRRVFEEVAEFGRAAFPGSSVEIVGA